ncbi:ABC transporter ATP-binding protein [soil metagenome]
MSDQAIIRTDGLAKDFGNGKGLLGIDLDVMEGEILGFLGPNGSGKSTAMRTLLNLIEPTGGKATIFGLDIVADSLAIRGRVGFVSGDFKLYGDLTGDALLDYFAALRGGVDRKLRQDLCERFSAQLDRPLRDLSTGNRQKIALVQAFMHEPELLILDEPITGLDPLVQKSFHSLLAEVRDEGRTVFLSSHTLSEVERVAKRVAVLREGKLVVVDTLENLLSVAVQTLEVEFSGSPNLDQLRKIQGVRKVEEDHRGVNISFEGPADPLVKALAQHEVIKLRSRNEDLEEVFLRYYRDDGEGAES